MTEHRKLRVFLCNASQDKPIVRELYDRLDAEGWIEPWLDKEKLLPGMNWDMEVEQVVGDTDSIIVCISNNAVTENKYVQRELKYVLVIALENSERSIFIIPLRLDECQIPRHVQPWQYYDFSILNKREKVYKCLVKSLEIRANLDPSVNAPNRSAHIVSSRDLQDKSASAPDILKQFGFVEIPPGKFLMGSRVSNPLAVEDEIPQHQCHISYDYWISRYPITNEQFGEFAVSNQRTDVLLGDW